MNRLEAKMVALYPSIDKHCGYQRTSSDKKTAGFF